MKKKISFLLALLIGISPVTGTFVNLKAQKIHANESDFEDKILDEVADNLELYFSKIGYFNEYDEYVVKDFYLLMKRANEGDFLAKKILSASKQKSLGSLITCVFKDQAAPILYALNGQQREALIMALAQGSWKTAAGILLKAAKSVGGKFFAGVAGVLAIVDIGMSLYTCRDEF